MPMPIFFLTMFPPSKTTASRMPKMAKAPPTMAQRLMRNSERGWWVAVMRTWIGETSYETMSDGRASLVREWLVEVNWYVSIELLKEEPARKEVGITLTWCSSVW